MSDLELELLRRKRLLEMKKHIEKKVEAERNEGNQDSDPSEAIGGFLIGRAQEVLEEARFQYPQAAKEVEKILAKLILDGKLGEKITGEELYGLFYRLGFKVRLKTQIRVLENGKLKSLEEKMKERTSGKSS